MVMEDVGACIDGVVKQYNLLRHPFYAAWMFGALTTDGLRDYSVEFYHYVASYPRFLREFARRLPAGELRYEICQDLYDREGRNDCGHPAHAKLWVCFAEALGADKSAMLTSAPLPKTQQLMNIFLELARSGSDVEALAAFYTYESQVPRLASRSAVALRTQYGMTEAACQYFDLYTKTAQHRATIWREFLSRSVARDPGSVTHAVIAAELTAKALWRAMDGIRAWRTNATPPSRGDGQPSLRAGNAAATVQPTTLNPDAHLV